LTEVANLLNERPLGTLTSSSDSVVSILTPNLLLLGRSEAKNPGGWNNDLNLKGRVEVVDQVTQLFWEMWVTNYAPTLVIQRKWKNRTPNLQPGDIVVVSDNNTLRGQYKLV